MNIDTLTFCLSQISHLVGNLSKKTYKQYSAEISNLVERVGIEAERHLFRCLFSSIEFINSNDTNKLPSNSIQVNYLNQELNNLSSKISFTTTVCTSIQNPLFHQKSLTPSKDLLYNISKTLGLSKSIELLIAIALKKSIVLEIRKLASEFVENKLSEFVKLYTDGGKKAAEDIKLPDLPIEALHVIFTEIRRNKNLSNEQTSNFFSTYRKENQPHFDRIPTILLPLVNGDDLHKERILGETAVPSVPPLSLADIFHDYGYDSCAKIESCKGIFEQYNQNTVTAAQTATCIWMMASSFENLSDYAVFPGNEGSTEKDVGEKRWNWENFIAAVTEKNPQITGSDVVAELDQAGKSICDLTGLSVLIGAIKALPQKAGESPFNLLLKNWKNYNSQFAVIQLCLRHNHIHNFAEHVTRPVNVTSFKQPIDEEKRDILVWKSLDLVECLLNLSEKDLLRISVKKLLDVPMKTCPDLLAFSLIQSTPNWPTLKTDCILNLLQVFVETHPNSAVVFQEVWNAQTVPNKVNHPQKLVTRSMSEWFRTSDEVESSKLSRILELAQETKTLTVLLNERPCPFAIDLAALAHKREYLKLDKWVADSSVEHGHAFLDDCVKFLKRGFPELPGPMLSVTGAFWQEALPSMLSTLQKHFSSSGSRSTGDPNENIQFIQSCCSANTKTLRQPSTVLNQPRSNPPNLATTTPQQPPNVETLSSFNSTNGLPAYNPSKEAVTTQSPIKKPIASVVQPMKNLSINTMPTTHQNTTSYEKIQAAAASVGAIGTPVTASAFHTPNNLSSIVTQSISNFTMPSPLQTPSLQTQQLKIESNPLLERLTNSSYQQLSALNNTNPLNDDSNFPTSSSMFLPSGPTTTYSNVFNQPSKNDFYSGFTHTPKKEIPMPTNSDRFNQPTAIGMAPDSFSSDQRRPGFNTAPHAIQPSTLVSNVTGKPNNQLNKSAAAVAASDSSCAWPDMNRSFSKEIEDKANSYFQRIYNVKPNPSITVDDILDLLQQFKESEKQEEREVFNCMMRNLFEEYRFFPQYPDKELKITACLFGGVIQKDLVAYMPLGIALRYVLEALRKPRSNKMFSFGIAALDRFKTKLKDYPQYCQHITTIPHFESFPAELAKYVELGKESKDPQSNPSTCEVTSTTSSSATSTAATSTHFIQPSAPITTPVSIKETQQPSIAKATNIDTLLGAQIPEERIPPPPDQIQDKVAFIFNNLSMANIPVKSDELRGLISHDQLAWLSQYLVMKRVSIEPNFHLLYSNFVDHLEITGLSKLVSEEVFRNIQVLLKCDKTAANFSDRSLLKNLGHFLGIITIGKNIPILFKDLDIKGLLWEANYKGAQELLYVVPFVAKICESISKSRIFKLPNPWTSSILSVLLELHKQPDLKLNLKFEVEVLCKLLTIDINTIKPSNYLKNQEVKNKLKMKQLSTTTERTCSSTTNTNTPTTTSISTPNTPSEQPVEIPSSQMINGIQQQIPTIGQTNTPFQPHNTSQAPQTTTTSVIASQLQQISVPPRFHFNDINSYSLATCLANHIVVKSDIPLVSSTPQLAMAIKPAIERAISDVIQPTVEKAMKLAVNTSEQVVRKDFALDSDEFRMQNAAHQMVRNLSAGMALTYCREQLYNNMLSNLKASFMQNLGNVRQPHLVNSFKDLVDQASTIISSDNIELACCYIQKICVEKAIIEIDKRLAQDYEMRKLARQEGKRFCDRQVLTYQAERMSEPIRLKVGGVSNTQMAVYEEFGRSIPGFLVSDTPANVVSFQRPIPQQNWVPDEVSVIYERCINEIESTKQSFPIANSPAYIKLQNLCDTVKSVKNTKDVSVISPLVQKVVEGLLDSATTAAPDNEMLIRFRNCFLIVLKTLQDQRLFGAQCVNKEVTKTFTNHRDELQFNVEIAELLIRAHLLDLEMFDSSLAQSMERGMNYSSVMFAFKLLRTLLVDEKASSPVTDRKFYHTLEVLKEMAARREAYNLPLPQLLELIRSNHASNLDERGRAPAATNVMHDGFARILDHERRVQRLTVLMGGNRKKAKEFDDPPGFFEKVESYMREWLQIYHSPTASRDNCKGFTTFLMQLQQHKIFASEDLINRFFRIATELFVEMTYKLIQDSNISQALINPSMVRSKCFHLLDAYVRLIVMMVKWPNNETNISTRIHFLNRILGVIIGVLLHDHENRSVDFHQMPYQRILIMLYFELTAPEHFLETLNTPILTAFTNAFHILRPGKVPGFAFAWLELISYRGYLSRMLVNGSPNVKTTAGVPPTWPMYSQLLIAVFKFLSPFLRNVEISKSIDVLYRGTLRLILVLLHDFPEFLCNFHYNFCDVIPSNCIQLRNLILSAFPRNMRLPDPFTPNLKVDVLSEINEPPIVLSNIISVMSSEFHNSLNSYLETRAPVTFLSDLRSILQVSTEPGLQYNVPLINSLVLYVGVQAINHLHSKGATPSIGTITHSSHMDIFQNLSVDLDTEGRYLFLNAIANQLRYPNSHTHYFSCTMLYLFAEANQEAIQEQITRVLLERLIVNRPHPWGLLITFIELIKNPSFKFWRHEFVNCAPEITKLFDSVARSCTGKQFTQIQPNSTANETSTSSALPANGSIPTVSNVALS